MELKDNTVIVVLGASGDLAKKKTVSPLAFPVQHNQWHANIVQFPALFGLVSAVAQLETNPPPFC